MLRILSVLVKQWPATCDLCFVPAGIFSGFLCNFSTKCDGLPTFIFNRLRTRLLSGAPNEYVPQSAPQCKFCKFSWLASFILFRDLSLGISIRAGWMRTETKGALFWYYSGKGIHGIDGIRILLGPIPFWEWTEYYSVHSATDSRMNEMAGIWFTPNRQNMRYFGKVLAGNDTRPAGHPPVAWKL